LEDIGNSRVIRAADWDSILTLDLLKDIKKQERRRLYYHHRAKQVGLKYRKAE
jgi:hypothetical protein